MDKVCQRSSENHIPNYKERNNKNESVHVLTMVMGVEGFHPEGSKKFWSGPAHLEQLSSRQCLQIVPRQTFQGMIDPEFIRIDLDHSHFAAIPLNCVSPDNFLWPIISTFDEDIRP